ENEPAGSRRRPTAPGKTPAYRGEGLTADFRDDRIIPVAPPAWPRGWTAMLGKLAPCGGGPPIPLLKPKLLVGRQRFCDIPLNFPNVSSRHCELELIDGYWFVRDLGSSNG